MLVDDVQKAQRGQDTWGDVLRNAHALEDVAVDSGGKVHSPQSMKQGLHIGRGCIGSEGGIGVWSHISCPYHVRYGNLNTNLAECQHNLRIESRYGTSKTIDYIQLVVEYVENLWRLGVFLTITYKKPHKSLRRGPGNGSGAVSNPRLLS